jgi:hypothetical protein
MSRGDDDPLFNPIDQMVDSPFLGLKNHRLLPVLPLRKRRSLVFWPRMRDPYLHQGHVANLPNGIFQVARKLHPIEDLRFYFDSSPPSRKENPRESS